MKIPHSLDIPSPDYPNVEDLLKLIMQSPDYSAEESHAASRKNPEQVQLLCSAIIAIANHSWRIASAAIHPETREPNTALIPQDIKKIANSLEKISETLENLGIRVIDRLGEPFNEGLPDQVITEEPREGINRELIIRTIRPTILWNQTMFQRGEIDIAIPADKPTI